MNQSNLEKESLTYHACPRPGKIEVIPTKPCATQLDLSLAYTPGVAAPCLEIQKDPEAAYKYTDKGNLVAVITNGTAVLGLGNIGALAGKPVMEGKGVLFKRFADIDVFDLEMNTEDPDALIAACRLLEPTLGGVNLEDIKAPQCFYIEEELKKSMKIPVFHDDQHGTAIVGGAALLNALFIAGKNIGDAKVVINGAGASGLAIANLIVNLGVKKENLIVCDTKGVIRKGRGDDLNKYKEKFAGNTDKRTLAQAVEGCDVLFGLSVRGAFTDDMIKSMAKNPIIMAMANPNPEITPEEVKKIRSDAIIATGRSDYPNQVNNVLCFPFIFRGALDVRASSITDEMKIAAAKSLAELARQEVPEEVCRAYGVDKLEFGREYILPKPFDPRVLTRMCAAVAEAAAASGVAARPITDMEYYKESLQARIDPARGLAAKAANKAKNSGARLGFAGAEDPSVISAAFAVTKRKLAVSVLLGDEEKIEKTAAELGIKTEGMKIINPTAYKNMEKFAKNYHEKYWRNGVTAKEALETMKIDGNRFGAYLLEEGEIDALIAYGGKSPEKAVLAVADVIDLKDDFFTVSSAAAIASRDRAFVISDPLLNSDADEETLAEAAEQAAEIAETFDMDPRIAFIGGTDFGSENSREGDVLRMAFEILKTKRPDLKADGEMTFDAAVNPDYAFSYPMSNVKGDANVLVFPSSAAADAVRRSLQAFGGFNTAAILTGGFRLPVQILLRGDGPEEASVLASAAVIQWKKQQGK